MNNTIRAAVAQVKAGHLSLEGLMDETGAFLVGLPQVCQLFQFLNKNAAREVKALLGKDFQFLKRKTKLNPKAVNAIALPDFEKLLRKLDKAGNAIAETIVDDLVGLSLHQLFCDAFEIEFDARDRQEWLKTRQASKEAFWTLGDAIKSYTEHHPDKSENYCRFVYPNCQDTINRGLFGKSASKIREELGASNLLRDHYGKTALKRLDIIQAASAALIVNQDIEPQEAIKQVLSMFRFESINYVD